ncbi:aldo/keto reductase [Herbiconiux sp. SYSU D00978]|uniref:aldo/keto reductase n=1 Tax=Herbiconiux sp. SYSU D00978 TaxID=2812562 RepID=UPI001A958B93|nr:aldo/keto reductase [Herbiconiux sp. SYSU D00978]
MSDQDFVSYADVRRTVPGTELSVFPIALDGSIFGWAAGIDDTREVLEYYRAVGGNFVMTADHYAGGRSEIMIGSWLETLDRDEVVVGTKIGRHPDAPGLSPDSIRRGVEASLERLRTDHIDLLAFDGDHPETPLEDSFRAAAELIAEGRVRHLAASAYSGSRLREANRIAADHGLPGFHVALGEYNLMERDAFERDLAPAAAELGIGAVARLPLASGYLTGEFRSRDVLPPSPMFAQALRYVGRRGNKVLGVLEEIAERHGAPMSAVALQWVMAKPQVVVAVVRAKDVYQLRDLYKASLFKITDEDIAALDRVSR